MSEAPRARHPFHLMLKPAGAACNLACEYCYYLAKQAHYPGSGLRMSEETLAQITTAYLAAHPGPEVVFGWQGGEPLLAGLELFRTALALQQQHAHPGQRVLNTLQTNGTLVTEEWAEFFAAHGFLVGVSTDGPPDLHDRYRHDRGGGPSYVRAARGLRTLQQHGVEVNALATVNRTTAEHPLRVYHHLLDLGFRHLQFIPIVERQSPASRKATPWSVRPEPLGEFLCAIFDHWARHDVGEVFVQTFESALNVWLGRAPTQCVHASVCGHALAVEHTGDLYACDHFVFPEHRRGHVTPETLAALVAGEAQQAFGQVKADLPEECRACQARPLCGGDCPKHRLRLGADGKPLSYLCPAYRRFFGHTAEVLSAMAGEIRAGRSAAGVMEILRLGATDRRS
jgi:uncharacterized protein